MPEERELQALFERLQIGDATAREELFPLLHAELRQLAGNVMRGQRPSHTLQATALVNEAYVRLCRPGGGAWNDSTHFFRLAATVMRQVLVDHARARAAQKRALPARRVELESLVDEYEHRSGGLVALDASLDRLAERDPILVQVVELRFFAGRSLREVSEILSVSERQVTRLWSAARLFLRDDLERERAEE